MKKRVLISSLKGDVNGQQMRAFPVLQPSHVSLIAKQLVRTEKSIHIHNCKGLQCAHDDVPKPFITEQMTNYWSRSGGILTFDLSKAKIQGL